MTRHLSSLVMVLAVPALLAAQTPAPAISEASPRVDRILLTAGRSSVMTTDFDITRLAVTNPAIADATAVEPRQILLDGKSAGTVSLIVWGAGTRVQYDIVVEPGVSTLQQQLQALFPGEDIKVDSNEDAVILSGRVSSTAVMLKAGEIAKASASKAKVLNLLQLPGATGSKQVMLQVRFAEVNRNAVRDLGASFFVGANGSNDFSGQATTGQYGPASIATDGSITLGDLLNLFVFNTKHNIGAVIRALETKGNFQSLAEPNLIAYDGQEASFLAGGQFPVPVVQGMTNAISIEWKEFGVRLKFTPTIAGDLIRLKVEPEVSSLDFNNGITLQGFRIPALITRRAATDVELRDGQSFAIAGLLQNTTQETGSAIPLLSSLPIVGNLFKSKSDQKQRTELMVLITPQLVKPLQPDEVPPLPVDQKRFLPGKGIGSLLQEGTGLVDAPPVKKDEKPVKK